MRRAAPPTAHNIDIRVFSQFTGRGVAGFAATGVRPDQMDTAALLIGQAILRAIAGERRAGADVALGNVELRVVSYKVPDAQ